MSIQNDKFIFLIVTGFPIPLSHPRTPVYGIDDFPFGISGAEERGQISTFDIRVPADVIRRSTKAEGKLSLTADLGPPLK